ncbi:MAG TPA: hypothetical protein VHB51_00360 [Candidatus Saccharimonadales bacterium]|nr:hypothetical protein [Candidatus Saccharimonadales bacterium]
MAQKQSDIEYYKGLAPKALVYSAGAYVAYWLISSLVSTDASWFNALGNLIVSVLLVVIVGTGLLYLLAPAPQKAPAKSAPKKKKTSSRKKR